MLFDWLLNLFSSRELKKPAETVKPATRSSGKITKIRPKKAKETPVTKKTPGKRGRKPQGIPQAKFDKMYPKLVAYNKEHGDTQVRTKCEDKELALFCVELRRRMARLKAGEKVGFDRDQIAKLDAIGFAWVLKRGRVTKKSKSKP